MPAHKSHTNASFQQERYARYRIFLQLPPVDAYIRAYEKDTKKDPTWRCERDARRIEKNKTVKKLMARFSDEVQVHEGLTPTAFCYRIQAEIEHARQFGAKGLTAIAKHTEMLGKVAGLMVDRHHHTHQQLPDEEATRQLAYLFAEHPDLAKELATEIPSLSSLPVVVDAVDSQPAPASPQSHAAEPEGVQDIPVPQASSPPAMGASTS